MQKGSTQISIVVLVVMIVGLTAGYYLFNQQKLQNINSFEECAKYYPVMESYPAKCNTPDGRHFVQELSDEETKKLQPPEGDETANWKTYTNSDFGYSIKYPTDIFIRHICPLEELVLSKRVASEEREVIDIGTCVRDFRFTFEIISPVGEVDEPKSNNEYKVTAEEIIIDNIKGVRYLAILKEGVLGPPPKWYMEVFIKKDRLHRIYLSDKILLPVFNQMLSTFKFLPASPAGGDQADNGCKVTGCSGQICAEEGEDIVTTCEFRNEYACYKTAKCERQADGKCGWTETKELINCLQKY